MIPCLDASKFGVAPIQILEDDEIGVCFTCMSLVWIRRDGKLIYENSEHNHRCGFTTGMEDEHAKNKKVEL